ncbi:MAG: DUF4062 domain-containing protein, partial [Psychrobacter sp.]|nr:DUF4062 domain-containing protein [Psychrobacter sp.]
MPNRRYHIHIACTADISPSLMDSLTLFFEPKAFLTRDLLTNQTQTAAYSRRCIDSCDYVLLVATDSYGERNNTGVSQLHLSYVYAKTKNKPMTALIKTHLATEPLSRQLKDFIDLVAQHIPHCHYFDDQSNIDELLNTAYEALLAQYPGSGWVRAKDALGTALNQSAIKNYLVNESSDLSRGSSHPSNLPAELADFQLLKASGRAGGETSDILWQDNKADNQPKIESTTKVDNTILPMA